MTEYPMYSSTQNQDVNLEIEGGQMVSEDRWEACWGAFANVKVRSLVVEIHDYRERLPEQQLLQPLQRVRADRLEVVLPWPEGLATTGDFRNAGFAVRRHPEGVNLMIYNDVDKLSEAFIDTASPAGIASTLKVSFALGYSTHADSYNPSYFQASLLDILLLLKL
ncbi:hypothetical protein HYALB_00012726 [Hymenoscyphus albidus]|uniref:DUF7730 domain-containing protein n=1 Tax=Hymenoscyphus albidus TaxID=595503 RepID=A0A9N9LSV0_9HELO|nr:hypothetical protein HYALB_00012726 [Hymenoscyphus albidus]